MAGEARAGTGTGKKVGNGRAANRPDFAAAKSGGQGLERAWRGGNALGAVFSDGAGNLLVGLMGFVSRA
jgi:hypothetical protein